MLAAMLTRFAWASVALVRSLIAFVATTAVLVNLVLMLMQTR